MSRATFLERMWSGRVKEWDHHVVSSELFSGMRESLLDAAAPQEGETAVDLGAGTGFVTMALAERARCVVAVDLSRPMLSALAGEAQRQGVSNVVGVVADLATLELEPASVDLVVSSYALHHLTDPDKLDLLERVMRWLRPGGRLVVVDMMFGRGTTARDRHIIRTKVVQLAKKGPAGIWRILKNLVRFGLRIGSERPASPQFWTEGLHQAGFRGVSYQPLAAEAGLVVGRAPKD